MVVILVLLCLEERLGGKQQCTNTRVSNGKNSVPIAPVPGPGPVRKRNSSPYQLLLFGDEVSRPLLQHHAPGSGWADG